MTQDDHEPRAGEIVAEVITDDGERLPVYRFLPGEPLSIDGFALETDDGSIYVSTARHEQISAAAQITGRVKTSGYTRLWSYHVM